VPDLLGGVLGASQSRKMRFEVLTLVRSEARPLQPARAVLLWSAKAFVTRLR
jgi:hypothetical protein